MDTEDIWADFPDIEDWGGHVPMLTDYENYDMHIGRWFRDHFTEESLRGLMEKAEKWDELPPHSDGKTYLRWKWRAERAEQKLEAVRKLVEQDLPQIIMTHYFRRRFYELTDFPVPDWFKKAMEAEDEA
ncbi:unnamed protein product [marine sediment metagenome]|uniref:Uncharacterized protein n=1 Tax=marine sediment metagenome TaxID=412755 RepID=X1HAT0_9ZZZZ